MSEPTPDTPQEREDKAEVLASEFRRFRWEIRFYYLGLAVFIVGSIVDS